MRMLLVDRSPRLFDAPEGAAGGVAGRPSHARERRLYTRSSEAPLVGKEPPAAASAARVFFILRPRCERRTVRPRAPLLLSSFLRSVTAPPSTLVRRVSAHVLRSPASGD